MKVILSLEGCKENRIPIGEVLLLLAYYTKTDIDKAKENLIKRGYITEVHTNPFKSEWEVTYNGIEMVNAVITDSIDSDKSMDELLILAKKLKEVFPTGKKAGTSNYWTEGKALIAKRLKVFFKKYGNSYTDNQIVEAAKKYVEGFNGNYQFMKTLKYFIFKDRIVDGEKEYTSDLLTYIENAGQSDNNTEWLNEVK